MIAFVFWVKVGKLFEDKDHVCLFLFLSVVPSPAPGIWKTINQCSLNCHVARSKAMWQEDGQAKGLSWELTTTPTPIFPGSLSAQPPTQWLLLAMVSSCLAHLPFIYYIQDVWHQITPPCWRGHTQAAC